MATEDDCLSGAEKVFEKITGRKISSTELSDMAGELKYKQRLEREKDRFASDEEIVTRATAEYVKDIEFALKAKRYEQYLNLKKRVELMDRLSTWYGEDIRKGIAAEIFGDNSGKKGSRDSVAAAQVAKEERYLGGIYEDLKAGNLVEIASSTDDTIQEQIAEVMFRRNRKEKLPTNEFDDAIVQIADIYHKHQEVARRNFNREGGSIQTLEGWVAKTNHDIWRISAAKREDWVSFIKPLLDWDKMDIPMHPEAKRLMTQDEYLGRVFSSLKSGVHVKPVNGSLNDVKFTAGRNIAKAQAHHRVLLFKDGKGWAQYNRQYGHGTTHEAVLAGVRNLARRTALVEKFGTNPEDTLAKITEAWQNRYKNEGKEDLSVAVGKYKNGRMKRELAGVDGSLYVPENNKWARIFASIRAGIVMSKLGSAVISQLSDATFFSTTMQRHGIDPIGSYVKAFSGIIERHPKEKMALLSSNGVYLRSLANNFAPRYAFAEDGVFGSVTNLQRWFFKLNSMAWATDRLRIAASDAFSHNIALNAGKRLGDLDDRLRNVLNWYDIDEMQWDIGRKSVIKVEGTEYHDAGKIRDLPNNVFEDLMEARNIPKTERGYERAKELVSDNFIRYYTDQTTHAVLEPDARTKFYLLQGQPPGTVLGELVRFAAIFKSFSTAVTHKQIFAAGMQDRAGMIGQFANMMIGGLILGGGAIAIKDMLAGRQRKSFVDPKFLLAAWLQGGGAGIWGDFLFSGESRFGQNKASLAFGPGAGLLEDTYAILHKGITLPWSEKPGKDAANIGRRLWRNVPFNNLYYTRPFTDYMIHYQLLEMADPGRLKRVERMLQREEGFEYSMPPSTGGIVGAAVDALRN